MYNNGVLTRTHALSDFCEVMTKEEFDDLPDVWKEQLQIHVDRYPDDEDDENWNQIVCAQIWCGKGPGPTQEEKREKFRAGIKNMREILNVSD